MDVSTTYELLS